MIEEAVKRIDEIRQQRMNEKLGRETPMPPRGPQAPEADENKLPQRDADDVFSDTSK